MTMVLAGLHWDICLVYIDDIIVMGRSFEEHLRNVAQVFQRLEAKANQVSAVPGASYVSG